MPVPDQSPVLSRGRNARQLRNGGGAINMTSIIFSARHVRHLVWNSCTSSLSFDRRLFDAMDGMI